MVVITLCMVITHSCRCKLVYDVMVRKALQKCQSTESL